MLGESIYRTFAFEISAVLGIRSWWFDAGRSQGGR